MSKPEQCHIDKSHLLKYIFHHEVGWKALYFHVACADEKLRLETQ